MNKHIKYGEWLLTVAFIMTFMFYTLFSIHLYLGNGLNWSEYFKTDGGSVWFVAMMILSVSVSYFLSATKKYTYEHFTMFPVRKWIVRSLVGFAILAEAFSISANQEASSTVNLNNDSAYQKTLESAPTISINEKTVAYLAFAEQKLARCKKRLEAKKEKHCDGDKAKVDSLKASIASETELAVKTNIGMGKLNANRQDKLKADSYNAVIVTIAKLASNILGGSYIDYIKFATILLMLTIASMFEIMHLNISQNLKETKARIEADLQKLKRKKQDDNFYKSPTAKFKYQQNQSKVSNHSPAPSSAVVAENTSSGIGFLSEVKPQKQTLGKTDFVENETLRKLSVNSPSTLGKSIGMRITQSLTYPELKQKGQEKLGLKVSTLRKNPESSVNKNQTLRKPIGTRVTQSSISESTLIKILKRVEANAHIKNGQNVKCPVCETEFTRKYNRVYCSNKGPGSCSDLVSNAKKKHGI